MLIGNKPKSRDAALHGKLYWWVECGKDVSPERFFERGWRGFLITILRFDASADPYAVQPCIFRWGFSFWLPFDRL
jgi:hypothetical protein